MAKSRPVITVETITPQIASQMLGTQRNNRPLRQRAVNRYVRDMVGDKWMLNGEAIKFSVDGRLLDGQHRLQAVILSEKSVQFYVVRGLDESAMGTLDTGVGRTYYDSTIIRGLDFARGTAPIARWWWRYDHGSPSATNVQTHQEIDDMVKRHPSIPISAEFIPHLSVVQRKCVASVQGFVHAYGSEFWDRDMADLFMHSLNDGVNLRADDPIFLLRKRLVDVERRWSDESKALAWTIKAWNAYAKNQTLTRLSWRTDGATPEPFPRFDRP